jgi:hypothetical protein
LDKVAKEKACVSGTGLLDPLWTHPWWKTNLRSSRYVSWRRRSRIPSSHELSPCSIGTTTLDRKNLMMLQIRFLEQLEEKNVALLSWTGSLIYWGANKLVKRILRIYRYIFWRR